MTSRKAAGAAAASANGARMCDQLAGTISTLATPSTFEFQAAHLAARFGLAADRARLTAFLAFGEAR